MHYGNLKRAEVIAALGGLLLAVSIVAAAANVRYGDPNAVINGTWPLRQIRARLEGPG